MLLVSLMLAEPGLAELTVREEVEVLRCGKQGELYSPLDLSCHPPLSQGPCDSGAVLVLDPVTLLAVCLLQKCEDVDLIWDETEERCVELYGREGCDQKAERLLFTMTGGTQCGCEEGWRRSEDGQCQQAGTRGPCEEGELLQQTDLSPGCRCQHWSNCQTFTQDASLLAGLREAGGLHYRAGVERLAGQVCDKQEEKVCCQHSQVLTQPLGLTELLLTLNSFYQRGVECATNNCPSGQIPWPARPGLCFSYKASKQRSGGDCRLVLTETEEVDCLSEELQLLSTRNVPGAFSSKCGRGRIWSRYRSRCVGLFF